jgi:hypothetical protein
MWQHHVLKPAIIAHTQAIGAGQGAGKYLVVSRQRFLEVNMCRQQRCILLSATDVVARQCVAIC